MSSNVVSVTLRCPLQKRSSCFSPQSRCLENRPDKRPSSVMLVQEMRRIESILSGGNHVVAPIEQVRDQLSAKEEECKQKDDALKEKDIGLRAEDEALKRKR